jgi:hypothetical protein
MGTNPIGAAGSNPKLPFDNARLARGSSCVSFSVMRAHILLTGFLILVAGISGMSFLPKMPGFEFLRGGLTLGGALVICGIFTFRMYWHGIIGAGIVSLIGTGKGLMGIKGVADWFNGDRSRGIAPILELGITVLCVILLLRVLKVLQAERTRRILEAGN